MTRISRSRIRPNSCPRGTSGHRKARHEAQHKWHAPDHRSTSAGTASDDPGRSRVQGTPGTNYDGEDGRRRLTRARSGSAQKEAETRGYVQDDPLASCCCASGIIARLSKRGRSRAALARRGRLQGIGLGRRGHVDGTHAAGAAHLILNGPACPLPQSPPPVRIDAGPAKCLEERLLGVFKRAYLVMTVTAVWRTAESTGAQVRRRCKCRSHLGAS